MAVADGDGDPVSASATVLVQTPAEGTESVASELQELVESGGIAPATAAPILQSLEQAEAAFDRGNPEVAVKQLGAAKAKIDAAVRSGRISAEEGQTVKDAIDGVISAAGRG